MHFSKIVSHVPFRPASSKQPFFFLLKISMAQNCAKITKNNALGGNDFHNDVSSELTFLAYSLLRCSDALSHAVSTRAYIVTSKALSRLRSGPCNPRQAECDASSVM